MNFIKAILSNPIHRTALGIIFGGALAAPYINWPDYYSVSWLGGGILLGLAIIVGPWLAQKNDK